ncbi:helicase RepA family protein [Rhodovulum sulfidophilum]|nr:helicase RepA family protein [Rhodovulum sulfidophilum]
MALVAAVGGAGFDMIVIDTMARVMGGRDENVATDIADLVRNLDLIRRVTGAHVMLCTIPARTPGAGRGGIRPFVPQSTPKSNCPATTWGRSPPK